jgi:probable HAF family extracellular repeat protein
LEERRLLTTYTVTLLQGLGQAYGINDSINSVGQSWKLLRQPGTAAPSLPNRPLMWNPAGVKTDLGTLGTGKGGAAEAINSTGKIAGSSNYNLDPNVYHAFYHNGVSMSDLGTLAGAGTTSFAKGLNSSNTVVGYSHYTGGPANKYHAFTWTSGGGMVDAHPTGAGWGGDTSQAQEINNAGQIVGFSNTSTVLAHTRAYRLSGGVYTQLPLLADWGLGTALGAEAYGINAEGDVVGGSYVQGGGFGVKAFRAFHWDSGTGTMTDLGDLGLGGKHSLAYAVNDSNVIVGEANTTFGDSPRHAFVWTLADGIKDLNTLIPGGSGWLLEFAYDINNSGHIVGLGKFNGVRNAFLLTPVPSPLAAPQRLAVAVTASADSTNADTETVVFVTPGAAEKVEQSFGLGFVQGTATTVATAAAASPTMIRAVERINDGNEVLVVDFDPLS